MKSSVYTHTQRKKEKKKREREREREREKKKEGIVLWFSLLTIEGLVLSWWSYELGFCVYC